MISIELCAIAAVIFEDRCSEGQKEGLYELFE